MSTRKGGATRDGYGRARRMLANGIVIGPQYILVGDGAAGNAMMVGDALRETHLSHVAFRAAVTMGWRGKPTNDLGTYVAPQSVSRLADDVDVSERTLLRAILELVDVGVITGAGPDGGPSGD